MQSRTSCAFLASSLLAVCAANPLIAGDPARPGQSGTLALSRDDALLVTLNPENDSITAFDVSGESPKKLFSLKVGDEPTNVAIDPQGKFAYVTLALAGKVAKVDLAARKVKNVVDAGREPHAVMLSPNGTRLYVTDLASNKVFVFDPSGAKPQVVGVVDLDSFGASPRTLAVTHDGDLDDTDETLYVALFFAQLRSGKTSLDEGQDDQKEGRIVAISTLTNSVLPGINPIRLAPMTNTGFNSNGKLAPATGTTPAVASTNPQTFTTPTGAYPNQLASLALQPGGNRAYVVSTGASPNGPLRFNSMAQGLVSVFDTSTQVEITAAQTDPSVRRTAPLNLNQGINLATTPAPRIFLTNPVAMAWRPDGSDAWIAVQNADCVVRLTVDGSGIPTIGAPLVAGPSSIARADLLDVTDGIEGKAPNGIVIDSTGTRAYVTNLVSRSVTVIDIEDGANPVIVATAASAKLPKPGTEAATIALGQELFYTGRGPDERMSSEAWGGCIVCHPNGRSDNVTWMFDAGPRQTINLDGMFAQNNPHNQRILNWSAVRDENQDFELNTRGVFGGRGLIDDDRVFFAFGGASGATPTDSLAIEQFHQFTNAVTATNDLKGGAALPDLKSARRDFAIATLADGRVFLIGGRTGDGDGSLVSSELAVLEFQPKKNKVKVRSSLGFTRRHSLGAAAVETADGPRVYAIGGYPGTAPSTAPTVIVEEYDPATDTWRTVAPLSTAVAEFGVAVAGGHNTAEPRQLIHVVSGNTGSIAAPAVTNATPVQRFQADPDGPGTWAALSPAGLTLRRALGAANALRGVSSRIFVVGGIDGSGATVGIVEEYQAQAGTIVSSPHTDLPAPRARFGIASSLSTNQVYVFGGVDAAGADVATIFEYTPANNGAVAGPTGTPSGTWTTKAPLPAARRSLQVSSPPGVTNFLVAKNTGRDARQDAIATWIAKRVRPARAPLTNDDPAALAGKTLFQQEGLIVPGVSCATCHGGAKWTRSIVDYDFPPSPELGLGLGDERVIGAELRLTKKQEDGVLDDVGTFTLAGRTNEIRFNGADISQAIAPLGANGFNIPSLLSVVETAPYFYSGLATTLEEVFDGSFDGNGGVRHHFVADPGQRASLIAFLRSIDADTKPFK